MPVREEALPSIWHHFRSFTVIHLYQNYSPSGFRLAADSEYFDNFDDCIFIVVFSCNQIKFPPELDIRREKYMKLPIVVGKQYLNRIPEYYLKVMKANIQDRESTI